MYTGQGARRVFRFSNASAKRTWFGAHIALACALALSACTNTDSSAQDEPAGEAAPNITESSTTTSETSTTLATFTVPPTTTPTTISQREFLDQAEPLAPGMPIFVSDDGYLTVGVDFDQEFDNTYTSARSPDGESWTFEPIDGFPDRSLLLDLVETSDGFAALVETRFERPALLTSTDLVSWQREEIPLVPGRPRAIAVSGDQIAVVVGRSEPVIITGLTGGPFTATPAPFEAWSSGDTFTGGEAGFLSAHARVQSDTPGVLFSTDGAAWSPISPLDEQFVSTVDDLRYQDAALFEESISLAVTWAVIGAANSPALASYWISSDLGASWSTSDIPAGFEISSVTTHVGEAGYAVQVVGDGSSTTLEYGTWFSSDGQDWRIIDFFEAPKDTANFPEGTTIDSRRLLAGVGDDSLLIRVFVREIVAGPPLNGLVVSQDLGGFLERIPAR